MASAVIPERKDIKAEYKWDLSPMFKSEEEWEALYKEIENKIAEYEKFRGRLGKSLDAFKAAIEFDLAMSRSIENLYTYAHLKSDEDKTNQFCLAMYQRSVNLYTRLSEASSFMTPEIQSIDTEVISKYMSDQSMKEYRFYLEKILRFRPHTLSKEIEQILAMSGEIAHAPSQIFSQLDNADIKFGNIKKSNGEEVELSHGNFSTILQESDRDVRRTAFKQYYSSYDNLKNTIASTLEHSNKKDAFYAKVRNFKNSREASLFSDNMPEKVYDNLVKTVRENTEPLFKYLDFRREALGLDRLHFYDTYVPIIGDVNFSMSYEEAVDTCVKALAPLGSEYTNTMREGLLHGWVDRYENRGKRSGAYSSGCYDSHPYILLNYEDENINSLYTLIHEAGHSMHSYYSKTNQPFVNADYTIFVAEVASTFNETLLSRHLLELYKDDSRMTAYILNREIDNIRATLYRQTMFAEFEKRTHEVVEDNEALTLEVMRKIYGGLLDAYFGDKLFIDDELTLECLRIPHFYSAFYVYKYATGISAAIALAEKVISEGAPARDAYLGFLKLGGSRYPLDELLDAGVDMSSPEPVESAVKHFSKLVERLVSVYSSLK
ncbi:MAG TPA: oligoendopeptidase F [Spirochaetota bacterium]|nr:oligoendopeptidase F [Spirochaetota bacterium]HPR37124.1 oligoendopeptidase F [Spirochaetota bacterium]HRX46645.1 oligoendopeptidase F [Spirochaetota bacterium]